MTPRPIKFRAWDDSKKQWYVMTLYDINGCKSLAQFTGLTDKNGKEIFEGDVVDTIYKRWPVTEKQGCFGIQMHKDFVTLAGLLKMSEAHGNQIEVIGNIYENPELSKP